MANAVKTTRERLLWKCSETTVNLSECRDLKKFNVLQSYSESSQ